MTIVTRRICAVLLILGLMLSGTAGAAGPIEGVDYLRIESPVPTASAPGRVEVLDIFWYGCGHCFKFKPYIEEWSKNKPEYVDLVRLPAVFRPSWKIHAQAWYAADALGIGDQMHGALFDAIHVQGRRLGTEPAIGRFVESLNLGVNAGQFEGAMRSPEILAHAARAEAMMPQYGVEGTPTVIVAGKYLLSPGLSGDFAYMISTLEALVAMEAGATAR